MPTTIYGEYVPSLRPEKLVDYTVPSQQLAGTVTNLAIGENMGVLESGLGAVTVYYNQKPYSCPVASSATFIQVTTYGVVPTAGTINLNFNGVSSGTLSYTNFTLTNVYSITTSIGFTANTRYSFTVTTAGWSQAAGGGLHIQVWGYTGN